MHKNNYIGVATDELYRIFDLLNIRFFDEALESPMITIQKAKRAGNYGWFSLDKIWVKKDQQDALYEINICAERLADDPAEIVGTLLHEMVHYMNRVNGVKDCSGQVHNKKFKALAESVGFIVDKSKRYGFGHTYLSDELKDFISNVVKPNESCFEYFRTLKLEDKPKKEKTIFTYICPVCGEKIKAKPDKLIICGDCEAEFEMVA